MLDETLTTLVAFEQHCYSHRRQPATFKDLDVLTTLLLELLRQVRDEHKTLVECVDDLAKHTGYQLSDDTVTRSG